LNNPALRRPLLIAVTILTSFAEEDLKEIGLSSDPKSHVLRLAQLTREAGLDGVVCSAQEARLLREKMGENFVLVTPGIRLKDNLGDDQRRIVMPNDAIQMGANYLVIGRSITQADDPSAVLKEIGEMIG